MSARARWPGWTRQRTLLLPVPPARWTPPTGVIEIEGLRLVPKRELHATLVGTGLGRSLQAAVEADRIGPDAVREAFERLDWSWIPTGRCTLLHAPARRRGGPERHALVAHLHMPAMADFHAALARLLGRALPVPPPHVTLYIAGSDRGIGLPDPDTLARYADPEFRDRPFTPSDPSCLPD